MILGRTKKVIRAIVDSTALKKKVKEEKQNLANTNNKSFLIFLKVDKLLILLKLKSLLITEFFPLKINSNQVLTPMLKVCKP